MAQIFAYFKPNLLVNPHFLFGTQKSVTQQRHGYIVLFLRIKYFLNLYSQSIRTYFTIKQEMFSSKILNVQLGKFK